MDPVETQYVERDGSLLAYQVIGNGPGEALLFLEINIHPDLMWTDPHTHALYERIAPSCRLVVMQRRGIGLSDPMPTCPTVEQQAEDILAVMDAVGLRTATLASSFSMCAAVALVAVTHPDRVRNLLLVHPLPTGVGAPTATEHGWPAESIGTVTEQLRLTMREWGSGRTIELWDPALATPYNRRLAAMMERCSATPAAAMASLDFLIGLDLADIFRAVQVPTKVVCARRNVAPESVVRHVAELIGGSEFSLEDHPPPGASLGEAWAPYFDMIRELTSDTTTRTNADRMLGTVLFTDLVKSTELLTRIGDAAYRDLRAAHERQVRLTVENSGGRLVNVIGDGTLSIFDRASDAVRCAEAICAESDATHCGACRRAHRRTRAHRYGHHRDDRPRGRPRGGTGRCRRGACVADGQGSAARFRHSVPRPGQQGVERRSGQVGSVCARRPSARCRRRRGRQVVGNACRPDGAAYRTTCPASGPWRGRGGQRLATKTRGSSLSGEVRLTEPDVLLHRCIAGRAVTSGE